jgi:SAM-dependent methyltransferase
LDTHEYQVIYENELHHWWYRGMESITRALLEKWYEPGGGRRILDAGCGTGGAMSTWLAEYGTVTGCDVSETALGFCRLRKARRVLQATVVRLPFTEGSFDLVTSLDVLYHRAVKDEAAAVGEMRRVLVPGGRALLRLPAYNWLRGGHDRVIHTRRRYTARQAGALMEQGGLKVERVTYANTILFPLALAKRLLEGFLPGGKGGSDLEVKSGGMNGLLGGILSLEAPLAASIGLPYGLSVLAVGRKPE